MLFEISEEKKAPLLQMPMSKKRDMLSMNTKTMARTQYESPNDYIQYLVCTDSDLYHPKRSRSLQ